MEGKEYTSIDQLPLVLSVAQLAAVLGIGINSAYQLVRSNIIRSIRIGRQYKIPIAIIKKTNNRQSWQTNGGNREEKRK